MIAEGADGFKLAVTRQLKRIESFKFKRTLNEFDLTDSLLYTWTDFERSGMYRQNYAWQPHVGLHLGVILRPPRAAPANNYGCPRNPWPECVLAEVRPRFNLNRSQSAAQAGDA